MMSREEAVADILRADAELMAILVGGVYTDEQLGIQGFRRGDDAPTDAAFGANGELLPCAVVREGAIVAYAGIRSVKDRITGVTQPIEIYFYQHRDKEEILLAKHRSYELLEQTRIPDSYPLMWLGDTPVFFDAGPVSNATTVRQDWRCVFLRKPE